MHIQYVPQSDWDPSRGLDHLHYVGTLQRQRDNSILAISPLYGPQQAQTPYKGARMLALAQEWTTAPVVVLDNIDLSEI